MKREAKRVMVTFSPEKLEELRKLRETIEREEKDELVAMARKIFAEDMATSAELAHTAELLKTERESQGLSLANMQDRTGISRAALCRLENLVDANPTISTLTRIAEALGKQLVVGLVDKT